MRNLVFRLFCQEHWIHCPSIVFVLNVQLVKRNDVSGLRQLLKQENFTDVIDHDELGQPALIIAIDHNACGEL